MANTCFNELHFTGERENIKQANLFLSGLSKDEWGGVKIEGMEGYFQDINFCNGQFIFGTRWGPDMETLMAVADRFKAGFLLDYAEPMMSLYGQAQYNKGKLLDVRLSGPDFKEVNYLEKDDVYVYKGRHFRSSETLCRLLLKEKLEIEKSPEEKKQIKPRIR